MYIGFIHYEKVFDTRDTWAIQRALNNRRIDSRYSKLLQQIADKSIATYQLHTSNQSYTFAKRSEAWR